MSVDKLLSIPVRVNDIAEGGMEMAIEADAETRAAIAREAGIVGVARLNGEFELSREGRARVRVVGTVSAEVQQTCVVTLEPITNTIEDAVDLTFVPPSELAAASHGDATEEHDRPEPLIEGAVDLGVIAVDSLLLAIDPYPRKPDAVFTPPASDEPDPHPFAVLAALKKPDKDGK